MSKDSIGQEEIIKLFLNVRGWQRKGERAPHKPLLLLYALAKLLNGVESLPFRETEQDLRSLLQDFGPTRKSYHPEYPFLLDYKKMRSGM